MHADEQEREETLHQLQEWLEKPMLALSFIWLALVVVEFVWGLNRALWISGQVIWAIFIAEFALSLALAPAKLRYVRENWLKALALAAPALRVLRLARFAPLGRASRGLCLFLALYGFAVFGYVTATLASFFVGRDAEGDDARSLRRTNEEVAALRAELRSLSAALRARAGPGAA